RPDRPRSTHVLTFAQTSFQRPQRARAPDGAVPRAALAGRKDAGLYEPELVDPQRPRENAGLDRARRVDSLEPAADRHRRIRAHRQELLGLKPWRGSLNRPADGRLGSVAGWISRKLGLRLTDALPSTRLANFRPGLPLALRRSNAPVSQRPPSQKSP